MESAGGSGPRPAGLLPPLSRRQVCSRLMIDAPPDTRRTAMEIEAAVASLQRGTYVLKFGRSGQPQKRFVRVNEDGDSVYWLSRRKKLSDSTIHFADVERIQRGQHTWTFARHGKAYGGAVDRSLSVVVTSGRSLDLLFDSADERDTWFDALQALLLRQRMTVEDSDLRYLRHAFRAEDVARSGRLSYEQVKSILRRLNIYSNKATLKRILERILAAQEGRGGAGSALSPSDGASAARSRAVSAAPPEEALARGAGSSDAVDSATLTASQTPAPAKPPLPSGGAGGSGGGSVSSIRLSLEEFVEVVDLLRDRPDVAAVYRQATAALAGPPAVSSARLAGAAAGSPGPAAAPAPPPGALRLDGAAPMSVAQFLAFLQRDQHEAGTTLEDARRLCAHFYPPGMGEAISLPAFTAYLTSPANSAFAPEAAAQFQDMDRPLAHYFIESSHNTYLEGDQLKSASSVNMYITAVQKGCRCVELDCWDGPDGEPLIYHGHTLTSRIGFADVCRALREYGFMTSKFPLILSLEIHCGHPQQQRMAEVLEAAFGDLLLRPSPDRRAYYAWQGAVQAAAAGETAPAPSAAAEAVSAASLSPPSRSTSTRGGVLAAASPAAAGMGDESPPLDLMPQLARLLPEFSSLPSPAALVGRVIVKAKIKKPGRGRPVMVPPPSATASAATSVSSAFAAGDTPATAAGSRRSMSLSVGGEAIGAPRPGELATPLPTESPTALAAATPLAAEAVILTTELVPALADTAYLNTVKLPLAEAAPVVPLPDGANAAAVALATAAVLSSPHGAAATTRVASAPSSASGQPHTGDAFSSGPVQPPVPAQRLLSAFRELAPCWHMSSIKETPAAKLIARSPPAVMAYCLRQLLRVYPGALRIDSSNFNPAPYWAAGVQMVALNYQTWDVPMRLNRAFFRMNGRCGYVLKPAFMRSPALLQAAAATAAPHPAPATQASASAASTAGRVSQVAGVAPAGPIPAPTPAQQRPLHGTLAGGSAASSARSLPGGLQQTPQPRRRSVTFARGGAAAAGDSVAVHDAAVAAADDDGEAAAAADDEAGADDADGEAGDGEEEDGAAAACLPPAPASMGRSIRRSATSIIKRLSSRRGRGASLSSPGVGDALAASEPTGGAEAGAPHGMASASRAPREAGHRASIASEASSGSSATASSDGLLLGGPDLSGRERRAASPLAHGAQPLGADLRRGSGADPGKPAAGDSGACVDPSSTCARRRSVSETATSLLQAVHGSLPAAVTAVCSSLADKAGVRGSRGSAPAAVSSSDFDPSTASGPRHRLSQSADGALGAGAPPAEVALAGAAVVARVTSTPAPAAAPADTSRASVAVDAPLGSARVQLSRFAAVAAAAAATAEEEGTCGSGSDVPLAGISAYGRTETGPRRQAGRSSGPQPPPRLPAPPNQPPSRPPSEPAVPRAPGAVPRAHVSAESPLRAGPPFHLAAHLRPSGSPGTWQWAKMSASPSASGSPAARRPGSASLLRSPQPSPLLLPQYYSPEQVSHLGGRLGGVEELKPKGSPLKRVATPQGPLGALGNVRFDTFEKPNTGACASGADAPQSFLPGHKASSSAFAVPASACDVGVGVTPYVADPAGSDAANPRPGAASEMAGAARPSTEGPPSPVANVGLRAAQAVPGSQPFTFTVTVLGAQHLPKRGAAAATAAIAGSTTAAGGGTGVSSPYCSVIIFGDPADSAKHKTRIVLDNGFNPVWSETFTFALRYPEVATLYIAVHDQVDMSSLRTAFLAYCAVPVAAIRSGYRSCPLRTSLGKKYPFCSLLCKFERGSPGLDKSLSRPAALSRESHVSSRRMLSAASPPGPAVAEPITVRGPLPEEKP